MITFLAVVGAWTLLSATLTLVWSALRHHTRTRAAQRASLLAHIDRHPAGRRIQPGTDGWTPPPVRYLTSASVADSPVSAPCGAWIGLTSEGWWELEFNAIFHVAECVTCQTEFERKAA